MWIFHLFVKHLQNTHKRSIKAIFVRHGENYELCENYEFLISKMH